MFNLSTYYSDGLGVEKDAVKAFYWCEKSYLKDQNYASAYNLANMLKEGRGCKADPKRALELYQVGYRKGCHNSMCNMASMYLQGKLFFFSIRCLFINFKKK